MLFNSYLFILLFLPLTLAGYFLLQRVQVRAAQFFLLCMSLWFYGYFNPWYLILICGSVAVNYCFSRVLGKPALRGRKALLGLALSGNIALIFVFKYYDFFIGNINALFGTDFVLRHLILPLGISFFTLQQISFVVDAYRGQTEDYTFLEYALFVTFFPQLVAGPIVLHDELIPQFRDPEKRRFQPEQFGQGVMMFTLGLAKKVMIADLFGQAVDFVYADIPAASSADLMIAVLSYTFQIYFDFSGYSDMAVGLGRMFNLTIPINFDSPYRSCSIPEFWRRWHMTLGRFLRRYVYYPLGGNRNGMADTLKNTMIVFLISGIWHGANHTFILWGLIHGAGSCIGRLADPLWNRIIRPVRWAVTFLFVNLAWGLFRADSTGDFFLICKKMFSFSDMRVTPDLLMLFRFPYLRRLLAALHVPYTDAGVGAFCTLAVFALAFVICLAFRNNYVREHRFRVGTLAGTWLLLTYCVLSLGRVSVFLYFNF